MVARCQGGAHPTPDGGEIGAVFLARFIDKLYVQKGSFCQSLSAAA